MAVYRDEDPPLPFLSVARVLELFREELHRRLEARSTRHHAIDRDDADVALAEVAAAAQTVADSLRSYRSVPRPGTLARAITHDGKPIGDVRVDESDQIGDAAGPWWSGTVVSTGEELWRLRPCHYAGPAEST